METPLLDATNAAIDAADHLTPMDQGTVEALRACARKIDAWDVIARWAVEDIEDAGRGARPAVPMNDNTTMGTYLKMAESLGLTPGGRRYKVPVSKDDGKKKPAGLAAVSDIPRPKVV